MKKIYLVRHGQTDGNVGPLRQGPLTPLNAKGREQAQMVADRCAKIDFETIISSSWERAKETAGFIAQRTGKPVEYSELFLERRPPTEVHYQNKDSDVVKKASKAISENFHKPDFKFSDEETFEEIKERARKAFEYLASRPEKNLLVVTHGLYLRVLMAYLVFGSKMTGEECVKFFVAFQTENTGISLMTYDKDDPYGRHWYIQAFNDHAHLG